MFQVFTPDGALTDTDHEALVEEMYDFQESLVGYLSYWPNISVNRVVSFATWAEKIENELPEDFVITRGSIHDFKLLISESAPKLEKYLERQKPDTQ